MTSINCFDQSQLRAALFDTVKKTLTIRIDFTCEWLLSTRAKLGRLRRKYRTPKTQRRPGAAIASERVNRSRRKYGEPRPRIYVVPSRPILGSPRSAGAPIVLREKLARRTIEKNRSVSAWQRRWCRKTTVRAPDQRYRLNPRRKEKFREVERAVRAVWGTRMKKERIWDWVL